MAIKKLQGTKVGHLLVLSKTTSKISSFRCQCICGKRITVKRNRLVHRQPKTHCGCLAGAHLSRNGWTIKYKREYNVWVMMRVRCTNPAHVAYASYGGRGIKVCPQWLNHETGFEQFVKDMAPRPENKSLDRIDPNGNYEPSNVRWATAKEQANNKRK